MSGGLAGITTAVEQLADRYSIPGAVIGFSNGRTIAAHAWGEVRTSQGHRNATVEHRFLLTSLTKVLTATQVMREVESGRLDIDTPVSHAIPSFAVGGKEAVTARHILAHTSGIRVGDADTAERIHHGWGPDRHLAAAMDALAERPPERRVQYCSSPFWVLPQLCTSSSGQDHVARLGWLMDRRAGCGLGYLTETTPPEDLVLPERTDETLLAEQARLVAYPAGGTVGCVTDLLTFGAAFLPPDDDRLGRRLLGEETLARMCEAQTTGLPGEREPDGGTVGTERALGWALGGPGRVRPADVLFHRGVSGTILWVDRRRSLVIAFLSARWFLPRLFYAALSDTVFNTDL